MIQRSNKMVNAFAVLTPLLHGLVKVAGLTPQTIEIVPGTLMNIWVPKETVTKKDQDIVFVPPTKPAVLFLHAFAMDGIFTWFPQVLALTRQYAVYVPDLLFFGGSITDRNERSTSFQAEFVAKGLGRLKVEKVTLVGLSYGGIVGFKMAELYPELVKSIVVSATVVELTQSISSDFYKKFGFTRWSDLLMPETIGDMKRLFSFGFHKFPWLPNFVYRHFLEIMYTNRKERHELLEDLAISDNEATSHTSYSQEIHMVWGDYDKIFDLDLAMTMKARLGDKTTLYCVKDAGHLVPLEQPFKYNKLLKCILERVTKYL
ncbi:putative triacylglycerol lipase [Helianthus anomalus]